MKSLFTLLAITGILAFHAATAQESRRIAVTGTVADSASGTPIHGAFINEVLTSGQFITRTATSSTGLFSISLPATKECSLYITAAGYEGKTIAIHPAPGTDPVILGAIRMQKKNIHLKEVIVSGPKNFLRQEVDRIIYDMAADPDSKSQNTFDLIRKLPLISVGANDEVQFKGESNFRILIDGRSTALTVGTPRDILKVLPAHMIDKIELITVPPARYDGEGLGGIINIVTNKKKYVGHTGNLSANIATMNTSANGVFILKTPKTSFAVFMGNFSEYPPSSSFTSKSTGVKDPSKSFMLEGNTIYNGYTNTGNLKITHEIDSLNIFNFSLGGRMGDGITKTSQRMTGGAYFPSYLLNKRTDSDDKGYSFDFNFEHAFRKNKQRVITFSYNQTNSNNDMGGHGIVTERVRYDGTDLRQRNKSGVKEQSAQMDYVHPVGRVEAAGGLKYTRRNNYSDFQTMYYAGGIHQPEPDETDISYFEHIQQIYAVYNSYMVKWKKWGLSGGLRLEHTVTDGAFSQTQNTIRRQYTNFIPSLALMWRSASSSSLNFNYTQRVQRPGVWQLNPFVDRSDPTYHTSGNPALKPVQNHVLGMAYSWYKKGYVNLGLNYSFASNTIQRAILQRDDTMSLSSFYNIGNNKSISLSLSASYPITSKLNISFNGQMAWVFLKGWVDNKAYNNSGLQGNAYAYLSRTFKNNWRATANAGFYSAGIVLQGQSNAYLYSSLSISKSLLKNKMTITGTVSNPFTRYRKSFNRLYVGDLLQEYNYRNYFRNIGISAYYNFGQLKNGPGRKVKGKINHEDTIDKTNDIEKGKL